MLRLAALLAALLSSLPIQAEGLAVIANPKVPLNSISVEELTIIYLIQKASWPNGVSVTPVNREASSAARAFFSEQLFNRSPADMSEYWDRLRFMGKFPPLVQTSDQAILAFVRSVPGAIGYVDADQPTAGVKVLLKLQ
jgi:ABC-type phosphate transport system substrate-binding protein